MSRKLKYDIPGADMRRTIGELSERSWPEEFAPDLPELSRLVLEIGFGRGEFLLDLASRHPESAFVGVEISFKRTLKMARKVARAELGNVRLIEGKGETVLEELFPEASLDEIWINFSDPWPKDRHARRRLVKAPLVHAAAERLKDEAVLHVATDDVPYAEQIDAVLSAEPLLENVYAPEPFLPEVPGRMHTGYEAEWREEGRPLHFFAYRRKRR